MLQVFLVWLPMAVAEVHTQAVVVPVVLPVVEPSITLDHREAAVALRHMGLGVKVGK